MDDRQTRQPRPLICVYDARDTACAGHGLGVLHPTACEVVEEAGGAYELTLTLPVLDGREAVLMALDRIIKARGAPKREAAREQLFRVTELEEAEDGGSVTVRARHITYDLAYDAVDGVILTEPTPADQAAQALMAGMIGGGQGVTVEASCATPIKGDWRLSGGINAFLDQEAGLVRQARARLIRDNRRLLLLPEDAPDRGAVIRWGGEMTGLSRKRGCAEVYTRLIPVGENADGTPLRLPEGHIDSPRLGDYSAPRIYMWKVSGAKVGAKNADGQALTENTVLAMLREAAQEQLQRGCDRPEDETEVGYLDLSRTEEYAGVDHQAISLYDTVTVLPRRGEPLRAAVSGYTYDCLAQRYTGLRLGGVFDDRTANVAVTAPQLRKTQRVLGDHNGRLELIADTISMQANLIEANARRIDLKADSTVTDALGTRVSQAEVDIDGINATVSLKASRDELQRVDDQLTRRISSAEIAIDGANAAISLKAEQTVTDALGTRVSAAEVAIDGANSRIALKADRIELQGYVRAEDMATETLAVMNGATVGSLFVDDGLNAGYLTTGDVYANLTDTDALTVAGSGAGWKSRRVLTQLHGLSVGFDYIIGADGTKKRFVTNVEINVPTSATLEYLGK